ncbi:hypothetical protein BWQ96_03709 [Gracilariopsis chorda]|uniref:Tudor domain-containing protein n=1 Tax=Gracilariopsis chorda TaxID=448386 RepID=A0A2V3IWF1_9FLOR|nr:hypothetical protein BWQ96_03709 [Gracilariopsis chorda]|eukprot:PXF46474.1 hypothetical protein BWQ96_03709 [Gracilariopsis chorda]
MATKRTHSEMQDASPSSPRQNAGKSISKHTPLSPQLSQLLHTACRLAAAHPKAMSFLSSSIRSMYDNLCAICRDTGCVPPDVEDILHTIDTARSIPPLQPSPQLNNRVKFLEEACEDRDVSTFSKKHLLKEYRISNNGVEMVDAVQLNNLFDDDVDDMNVLVDSGDVEQIGIKLNADHKLFLGERLGIPIRDQRTSENPRAVLCDLTGDIIGEQVEVFSVADQTWRSAVVSYKLPDGRHVLVYFDGVVERVMLREKLWRPVA